MNAHDKNQQLLKILIGAAWIDGIIQTEERDYLRHMAESHGVAEDTELKNLLSELKPVQPAQCYQWLEEYLGDNPTSNDYQELLETLSALIYSDGDVQMQEAQLLTKLQLLDPAQDSAKSAFDKMLKTIQKLYRKAITQKI
ncbi:TerB family tellurite resistance protein [Crocosphaera sp. UHCC 0190]|uniref:tellurite resistance TerB family protein n=1 Tax=Crocosphaera sp. UHCC 0190 TaxID=3110246 RepID=UPI002B1EF406|nr:TerB family tellurite resistance protein [Crocosphaera sp. UHCC 0190]MEA5510906.1 TerB family tellurite resistance protein [Crocosphaera sp. UHCC 0190]